MNLCKTCGTICPFDDERKGCDAYSPMTNENWFISLPTEEKAKLLNKIFRARTFCHICPDGGICDINYKCKYNGGEIKDFVEWLKEKHE